MQPTYLPWLGFFDLMDLADEFVLLDTVQFERHSWQHRNRIKGPAGEIMLTVPVSDTGLATLISEAETTNRRTIRKHCVTVEQSYARAPHLPAYREALREIYDVPPPRLLDLTLPLIDVVRRALGIDTPVHLASDLPVAGHKDHLVRSICDALGAARYLATAGSREYMEAGDAFLDGQIDIEYHSFACVPYRQLHGPFLPYLAALDALLNLGPDARSLLENGRGPVGDVRSSGS